MWKKSVDGSTLSSPALVDALGNGRLQVAEGTSSGRGTGTAYLVDGANGKTIWSRDVAGQVIGGITSADIGAGYQDLLVPTTGGLYVLDGRTGAEVALLGHGAIRLQSSPLVTDDANGTIGITVAGYNARGGMVVHWEVAGSNGRRCSTTIPSSAVPPSSPPDAERRAQSPPSTSPIRHRGDSDTTPQSSWMPPRSTSKRSRFWRWS